MANLTITATSVVKGTTAQVNQNYVAGEAVTAGQGVYLKQSAEPYKWYLAQCDGTTEESGSGVQTGIALHAAAAGQPLAVQVYGSLTIGATVAAGVFYYVSATAGSICLSTDLATANKVTQLGYGLTTSTIQVAPVATGLALA